MTLPLSIIIPTLNAGQTLDACLDAVIEANAIDIIVVDGGSADNTRDIAENRGVRVISSGAGRGKQMAMGGSEASAMWLLFLHADTILEKGWSDHVAQYIRNPQNSQNAAYFEFSLDSSSPQAQRLEKIVSWRCRRLGLPYGDQGLLIHSGVYRSLGGFSHLPLMEDVEFIRRIRRKTGAGNLNCLPVKAVTAADKYQREGYLFRSARNLLCLTAYLLGVPPHYIARIYG